MSRLSAQEISVIVQASDSPVLSLSLLGGACPCSVRCRTLIVWWLRQAGRTLVDRYVTYPSHWSFSDRMRHLGVHRVDQSLLNGAFSNLFAGLRKVGKVMKSNTSI